MAGTFVETPSRALTIEHEPTGRALTQFKPEEARENIHTLDLLASYGVKLRDDSKLRELAIKKLELVADIIDWYNRMVFPVGHNPKSRNAPWHDDGHKDASSSQIAATEALEILGYSPKNSAIIGKWRKMYIDAQKDTDKTVEKLILGWKYQAGILFREPKPKIETDRDLAVEMIFRAYTKLDPDQRIELKERIMAFEKSYKDPFAFKAA